MTTEIIELESAVLIVNEDTRFTELFISSKRSLKTQRAYAASVSMLVDFLNKPFYEVTLQDGLAYHEFLKRKYSSLHSIKLHIDIAKSLFDFGVDINYLRSNVMKIVKTDTPNELTHKRIMSEEQVLRLIDAPKRQRDKLLLRLVYAAGLRVSEVCNLIWGDLSDDGVLHIRNGKGQRDRFITISADMQNRLKSHRGGASDNTPVFVSQKGGCLDESAVHRIIKTAAKSAGIDSGASMHWLRHSHASHALDRGASIVTVRDTLGHSNISTTNKYLHGKRRDSSALHLSV